MKLEENNNLQNNIRILQQENEGLRRTASEFEVKITQITHEYQSKIKSY
jgi:transcription initiation factor TFIID subunit TAF12